MKNFKKKGKNKKSGGWGGDASGRRWTVGGLRAWDQPRHTDRPGSLHRPGTSRRFARPRASAKRFRRDSRGGQKYAPFRISDRLYTAEYITTFAILRLIDSKRSHHVPFFVYNIARRNQHRPTSIGCSVR